MQVRSHQLENPPAMILLFVALALQWRPLVCPLLVAGHKTLASRLQFEYPHFKGLVQPWLVVKLLVYGTAWKACSTLIQQWLRPQKCLCLVVLAAV